LLGKGIRLARYPTSCDAPVDVITKKQALLAMNTLPQTLLILARVGRRFCPTLTTSKVWAHQFGEQKKHCSPYMTLAILGGI
jgi:hypothetical protein